MKKIIKKESYPAKSTSPYATGGGGYTFEHQVGVIYLVSMLTMQMPIGVSQGLIKSVQFQTRYSGNLVDDIKIVTSDDNNECKLLLQVRRKMVFTEKNKEFREVIIDCWKDFNKEGFNELYDRIGIAIGIYYRELDYSLQPLLRLAETSNSEADFIEKENLTSKKIRDLYELFKKNIEVENIEVSNNKIWRFLKCFTVLYFDLELKNSHDYTLALNSIKNIVKDETQENAKIIFDTLYKIVSDFAINAGTIDLEMLKTKIPNSILKDQLILESKTRKIVETIMSHAHIQIEKQKKMKRYIPEVFVETDSIKEEARYFVNPVLFWNKMINDIKRLNFSYLNDYLNKIGCETFIFTLPEEFKNEIELGEIKEKCKLLIDFLNKKKKELNELNYKFLDNKIPKDKLSIFNEIKYTFGDMYWFIRKIDNLIHLVSMLSSKVFLILSKAGQGKTNFICDLIENVINKNSQLCFFFNASEFNHSNLDRLDEEIIKKVYGYNYDINFNEFLKTMNQVCSEKKIIFTFIIDGLNEYMDVSELSTKLEKFIEYLMQFDFIKLILTCRTEYFEERFKNFLSSSFSDHIVVKRDFNKFMNDSKKERMFHAYLKFFNIRLSIYSQIVYEKLTNDPLLLRIFCESYKDTTSVIPPIYDIYKENLFRKYFEVKTNEIDNKKNIKSLDLRRDLDLRKTLNKILSYMLGNNVFNNIPLNDLLINDCEEELIKIIDEDIIFRKDLLKENILSENSYVLNFTFDEFRDYLIANFLIHNIFKINPIEFESKLDQLIKPQVPVAEGVSKYIFYISKRENNYNLTKLIQKKNWYENIYFECIFSMDDRFILEDDIKKIENKFMEDLKFSSIILISLIHRHNVKIFKRLNIENLFLIVSSLSAEEYVRLVNPVFENEETHISSYPNYYRWGINKLIDEIEEMLFTNKGNINLHIFFELLLLLMGVTYKLIPYYKTIEVYKKYIDKYPKRAIKQLIKYVNIKNDLITIRIKELLMYYFEKNPQSLEIKDCLN